MRLGKPVGAWLYYTTEAVKHARWRKERAEMMEFPVSSRGSRLLEKGIKMSQKNSSNRMLSKVPCRQILNAKKNLETIYKDHANRFWMISVVFHGNAS
jgi:hypothetical protein